MPRFDAFDGLQNPSGHILGFEHDDDRKTQTGLVHVLHQSSVPFVISGTTVVQAMRTITLPKRILGLSGLLVVRVQLSWTNSVNNKAVWAQLNGQDIAGQTTAAGFGGRYHFTMWAAQSYTSQKTDGLFTDGQSGGVATRTVDLTVDQPLVIFGNTLNAADTLTLEHSQVLVYPSNP